MSLRNRNIGDDGKLTSVYNHNPVPIARRSERGPPQIKKKKVPVYQKVSTRGKIALEMWLDDGRDLCFLIKLDSKGYGLGWRT